MPGLFGILAKRPSISAGDLRLMACRMADSMRRVPWLRTEIWGDEAFCGGRVHLGVLNGGPQPLVTRDGRTRVWLDGELFLERAAGTQTGVADDIAVLLQSSGDRLSEADGVFALACFDDTERELQLANDRLGLRPLYVTETEDWYAYAAEVKALLAIHGKLPDVDEVALRQFFGFDHMLGDRTWWRGIELLPPGAVACVSERHRAVRRYWTFDEIRREPRPEAEVQAELGRLWPQAVGRHSRPDTMPLLLSGGQDSRLLLAELRAQGADTVAITCGATGAPDMTLARACAAIAGVPHRPCYLDERNWWDRREEAIWQTDGLASALHFHVAIAADEMHRGSCYSPMNFAGDLLFGGSHLDPAPPRNGRHTADRLLRPRYQPNPFFAEDEVVDASMPDARRYLEGASSDCFHLLQRVRRFTLSGPRSLAAHCEIVFPSVSYRLLRLSLGSLRDAQRINHRFYNRWLLAHYPRFYADIPWQATGRGLDESLPTKLRRAIRRNVGRLVQNRATPPTSDQWFVDYPACVRSSKIIERLLAHEMMADELLHGAGRRALADAAHRPLSVAAILAILTLETYLRQVTGMPAVVTSEMGESDAVFSRASH